jgi:hypothetical protein
MKLVGEYIYKVYYILPDGSKIDINRLINFSLNDNYGALKDFTNYKGLYFDATSYGILEVEYYEIESAFKSIGIIDDFCKILDVERVKEYLIEFDRDATELINNKNSYIRETKLNKILNKNLVD